MNKSIYNNKLRAAKRRIFDSLKKEGLNIIGVKHRKLISIYFNRNDIQRPIELRWQDIIIKLYEQGLLGDPEPKKKKPKESVPEWRQKYLDYIDSKEWKEFRSKALIHFGHKCGLCNSPDNLHVHHKNYLNLYKETFDDVIPLCRKCHMIHHNRK